MRLLQPVRRDCTTRWIALVTGLLAVGVCSSTYLDSRLRESTPSIEPDREPEQALAASGAGWPSVPDGSPVVLTVSGRVVDSEGLGVGRASVCAWSAIAPCADCCADTEVNGRYSLALPSIGRYAFAATAEGFAPTTFQDGTPLLVKESLADLNLAFTSAGVLLAGSVQDIYGGPVEGAQVSAPVQGRLSAVAATSDSEGHFRLWLAPGRAIISARGPGYAPLTKAVEVPAEKVSLVLFPEASIRGLVRGVERLADCRVESNASSREGAPARASGEYTISGLMPGLYQPRAICPGAYGEATVQIALGAGEIASVDLVVLPAFRVAAHVLLEGSGEPCGAGQVILRASNGSPRLTADINPDGSISWDGVPRGTYEIDVRCKGRPSPLLSPLKVEADLGGVVWPVPSGSVLKGQITATENPLEGVHVRLMNPENGFMPDAEATSDGDGRFALSGLPPGSYVAVAEKLDWSQIERSARVVVPSSEDLTIRMHPAAVVEGTVTWSNGVPAANASVSLLQEGGDVQFATTDDAGTYRFHSLAPGMYRLSASPSRSSEQAVTQRVEVGTGVAIVPALTLGMSPGDLAGVVIDDDGSAIDGLVVLVLRGRSNSQNFWAALKGLNFGGGEHRGTVTDASGRFRFTDLEPGDVTLLARSPDAVLQGHVAASVPTDGEVKLVVQPGCTLAGRVVSRSQPVERFRLQLDPNSGGRLDTTWLTPSGVWEYRGLPCGEYRVAAEATEGRASVALTLAPEGSASVILNLE